MDLSVLLFHILAYIILLDLLQAQSQMSNQTDMNNRLIQLVVSGRHVVRSSSWIKLNTMAKLRPSLTLCDILQSSHSWGDSAGQRGCKHRELQQQMQGFPAKNLNLTQHSTQHKVTSSGRELRWSITYMQVVIPGRFNFLHTSSRNMQPNQVLLRSGTAN